MPIASIGGSRLHVSGIDGMILMTIDLAKRDALMEGPFCSCSSPEQLRDDAIEYFRGDTYRTHLGFLGVRKYVLPDEVEGIVMNGASVLA